MKILVIGDNNTGKTALIEKITKQTFTITQHVPTFGINFYQYKDNKNNNNSMIEFLDCSGNYEYMPLIEIYCRETDFIFLCFDVSEISTYQSIKKFWLPYLQNIQIDSKIIFIGNKNDLSQEFPFSYKDLITLENTLELQIYTEILVFSAKNDTNFEKLLNILKINKN